ncbi:unnamed protein product, partial [Pylaiella littoralis]
MSGRGGRGVVTTGPPTGGAHENGRRDTAARFTGVESYADSHGHASVMATAAETAPKAERLADQSIGSRRAQRRAKEAMALVASAKAVSGAVTPSGARTGSDIKGAAAGGAGAGARAAAVAPFQGTAEIFDFGMELKQQQEQERLLNFYKQQQQQRLKATVPLSGMPVPRQHLPVGKMSKEELEMDREEQAEQKQ